MSMDSVSPRALEDYLHENIPITVSLGVCVTHVSLEKVSLQAPFNVNINHKRTVFGGSLHALSTLAGWSLLFVNLKSIFDTTEIVIANSEISYLIPVTTDFVAHCVLPEEAEWMRFEHTLERKGKARIKLATKIYQHEDVAVNYCGTFVVLKK